MPSKLGSILDMAGMVIKNLATPTVGTDAANKSYVDAQVALASGGAVVPPGVVQMYGGAAAPTGWFICDGAAYSRTTYAALFAILGTAYGPGDGSTTFNVPDMRSRFPIGAGLYAARGNNELGVPTGVLAEEVPRQNRMTHTHDHTGASLVNSSTDLNLATNTTTGGSASRIMQQNHTHTISGRTGSETGLTTGSVHAHQALVFIIKT